MTDNDHTCRHIAPAIDPLDHFDPNDPVCRAMADAYDPLRFGPHDEEEAQQ